MDHQKARIESERAMEIMAQLQVRIEMTFHNFMDEHQEVTITHGQAISIVSNAMANAYATIMACINNPADVSVKLWNHIGRSPAFAGMMAARFTDVKKFETAVESKSVIGDKDAN